MSNRPNSLLVIALGSVLISFIAMMVIMWRIGFFTFSGTDPSSKVVAAALALVGAFTGTIVSMVGILLKHSIDQQAEIRQKMESDRNASLQAQAEQRLQLESERNAVLQTETERRLQLESERNASLQRDAEQRLKLEAAVRALQLFSTTAGAPTPPTQRDGALFALDSLGQYELTLLIVRSLLEKREISPATTTTLLDHAILRGDAWVQVDAVAVFETYAAHMITASGAQLPWCLLNWVKNLPDYVREWAPFGMAKLMMARPVEEWISQFRGAANAIVATLCLAWNEEAVPRIKDEIGAILKEVFLAFPDIKGVLCHPRTEVDVDKTRQQVIGSAAARGSLTVHITQQLSHWRQGKAISA